MHPDASPRPDDAAGIRRLLLALVALGCAGLTVELVLLEHTADPWQWTPFVALAAALVGTAWLGLRPSRAGVRAFQALMAALVAIGLLGVYLHYDGNAAFELEMEPGQRGLPLVWRALRGATPALAPAALAQLGLVGLVAAWRHPAADTRERPTRRTPT